MKIFVTGVAGQLGHDVMNDLAARGYEGIVTDIAPQYSGADDGTAVTKMPYVSLDITDRDAVEKTITELKPDVVVHCAAWTAVDLAEDDDKKAKVHAINADGTQNIADACKKIDAKMVYIDKLTVVSDQIGTPTYTLDLSRLLVDMIETDKYGYYHATNEGGYISWYDFTKEIFKQAVELGHTEYSEDRLTVVPVTTAEYGVSKAARPFNSRLDKSKLVENGFKPLPTWQDALHRYLQEIEF